MRNVRQLMLTWLKNNTDINNRPQIMNKTIENKSRMRELGHFQKIIDQIYFLCYLT